MGDLIVDNLALRPSNLVAEYTGAPAGRDYDFWREDVCRNFCRVDAEPSAGSQIFCKIEIAQVGSLALAKAGGKSGRFLRTRDLLSDSCDDFVLFAATSGDVLVVRERRAVELQQSQMWLTDLTVEGAVAFNDDHQFATISNPATRTARDLSRRREQAGRATRGQSRHQRRHRALLCTGGRIGHIAGPDRTANDSAAHG